MTAKDNEGNKGEVTDITKVKFVVVVFVSSVRWVMSVAGMVES